MRIVLTGRKADELLAMLRTVYADIDADVDRQVTTAREYDGRNDDPFTVFNVTGMWCHQQYCILECHDGPHVFLHESTLQKCKRILESQKRRSEKEYTKMSEGQIRLAHIYLEQADTARQQSNLDDAIAHFGKAIDIYKKLADKEPACWSLVADTIERVAATYKAAGVLDKAAEAFKEAATLRETLVKREEAEEEEES